jgi:nicotinamidase-related amidase
MTTALLIVDMQNAFVRAESPFCIPGAQASIPELQRLLGAARDLRWLVVHVVREHRADASDVELPRRRVFLDKGGYAVPGTWGVEIVDELLPLPSEHRIVKPRFSAFMNTNLDSVLRRHGVSRVVVSGTQYPNCIRATAFDALSLDYDVCIARDATSAASVDVASSNIRDLENVGIPCLPTDELLRRAGQPLMNV